MQTHKKAWVLLLSIAGILTGCGPRSSSDFHLMEPLDENRVPRDSDLEYLSSLEHHRLTKGQSKLNEHSKRRLVQLFRIFKTTQDDQDYIQTQNLIHNSFSQDNSKQPGLIKLSLRIGNNSFNVYDAF